jgi:hypothetical protein
MFVLPEIDLLALNQLPSNQFCHIYSVSDPQTRLKMLKTNRKRLNNTNSLEISYRNYEIPIFTPFFFR